MRRAKIQGVAHLAPLDHRQVQALRVRAIDGVLIAGIGMAHDAGAGIVPQNSRDPFARGLAAVADDHHAACCEKPMPRRA